MIKSVLATGFLALLLAACSVATGDDLNAKNASAATQPASTTPPGTKTSTSDGSGIPAEIKFGSAVGEVVFQHQKHLGDRSINCVECHHQINAKTLKSPHPEYLTSTAVNCQTCHKDRETTVYSCSQCHDAKRRDIADETLSAKVVIHKQCRKCHDVGTGQDASKSCALCHQSRKGSSQVQ
jgi:hypothetical protein